MSLERISLPEYTRKQEWWNAISHFCGLVFGLIAGPFLLLKACKTNNALTIAACAIYLVAYAVLYAGSALYHALLPGPTKKIMRVLDHDNVYLLIMGSYTPYTWIGLAEPKDGFPWGWIVFGVVWSLCILGIVFNSVDLKKFSKVCMVIYVGMGSAILAAFYPLYFGIGLAGILTLLGSGVFYWVGAMLYAMGKKRSFWYHTVFHFFVLAATTLMFFSIYFFVL